MNSPLWMAIAAGLIVLAGCSQPPAPDVSALLQQAKGAIRREDYPQAIRDLDALLKQQPHLTEALVLRAQLAREAADDAAALDFLQQVTEDRGAAVATARYLEGSILLVRGEARQAEALFRQSMELQPAYRPARMALVELLLTQLRGAEARHELLELRKLRPWSLQQLVQYQASFANLARPDNSRSLLEGFLKYDAGDRASRMALVRDLLTANLPDQAIMELKKGLAESPGDVDFQGLLTEALVQAGSIETAAKSPGAQFPREAGTEWQWRGAAAVAEAQSAWARAAAAWWFVVERSPDDRTANYRLAVALERAGQNAQSQAQFQRTRQVELLQDHVTHILAGDTQRTNLVAQMAIKTADLLLDLQRPADSRLWFEFSAGIAPQHPALGTLGRRLAETQPTDQAAMLAFGKALLARAGTASEVSADAVASWDAPPAGSCPIRLVDEHAAAGLNFQHFNGPTEFKYLLESLGGGVAVLDYDGDGWPDLYLPQGCRIPYAPASDEHLDRLFRNRGDGTFEDVTEAAGLRENRYSQGVTVGDFDNDGDPDIVVGNYGRNTFFRNNGDGTFSDASDLLQQSQEAWTSSLAWADLDRDGDLDLYVVNYVLDPKKICRTPSGALAACSPGNFEGEADFFYLNNGDGTLRPVPLAAAGLDAPEGKGLGIVVAHLDEDEWPEIYVSNDGTPNFLFRHTGQLVDGIPQFIENGFASGAAVSADGRSQAGMGIACADLNGDHRADLYVTHFFNDYNTLYLNSGDGLFEDQTARFGLVTPTMQRLGFGTQPVDFDLDGWPELLIANGHIDDFRSSGVPWKMEAQLFWNRGGQTWVDASAGTGEFFAVETLGRGVARIDWNCDGLPDAVMIHQDRPAALLTNRTSTDHHSISLRLVGRTGNRDAIGARIRVEAGGFVQTQELCGGNGYFAVNDAWMAVGVGQHNQIDRLKIDWPDGSQQTWENLAVNRRYVVRQQMSPLVATSEFGQIGQK